MLGKPAGNPSALQCQLCDHTIELARSPLLVCDILCRQLLAVGKQPVVCLSCLRFVGVCVCVCVCVCVRERERERSMNVEQCNMSVDQPNGDRRVCNRNVSFLAAEGRGTQA